MCMCLWLSSMPVSGRWLPYRTQRLLIPRSVTGVQRTALLFSPGCCFKFTFEKCRENRAHCMRWCSCDCMYVTSLFFLESRVEGGCVDTRKGWTVGQVFWRTLWFQHAVVRGSGIQGLVASHETISQESRNNSSPHPLQKMGAVEVVSAVKSACPTIMGNQCSDLKICIINQAF